MAKISRDRAEVNARIVYWGIEGAGKRTSLEGVYRKLRPDHRGEMREVPTRFDPSVSYTVLPIELGDVGGMRTRIELVAVPGAPEHAPTRKQLLDQVDGIVFVVDCRRERAEENLTSLEELGKALEDYARSIDEIPLVVQYNKRDHADAYGAEELHRRLGLRGATVFEAVATEGTGLLQPLSTISKKVIRALRGESQGQARTPLAPAPDRNPELPPPPVAPAPPLVSPQQAMEEAILAEPDHPDHLAIDAESRAAASALSRAPFEPEPIAEDPRGARIGAALLIVSVGEATLADARSVRIPLVLGDDEGGTSAVVLTISLDPFLEKRGD
ncbi:MAG TPA: ADP-ribosylation factor-like protein [Myxococcota bacterium]|nr:ADP-ribosylation factor-like protein [Myxococcota bacterium]